jgi:hypothetical protein
MNKRCTHVFRALLSILSAGVLLTSIGYGQTSEAHVNGIALLGSENGLQLKITSSAPVATDSQVLSGPDRIVIDFPGALPGKELRGFAVKQSGVRAVRVGLFASNPPRTRVVIDLERPMQFQLLPSGNSVFIKLGSAPAVVISVSNRVPVRTGGATITPPPPPPAQSPLQVTFNQGQLWVSARNATLAEVLYQVHLRTGADIPIPAGAEQEKVVLTVGPGPAKEVMAALLNGSRFNFVLVGSAKDQNELRSVILTPKMDIGNEQGMNAPQPTAAPAPQPQPEAEIPSEIPSEGPPPPQPDAQPNPPQPDAQQNPQQPGVQAQPPQPGVPGQPAAQPVPEAPIPNQGQGQTIPAPTAPPPPPTPDENLPWTEPPPSTPQPD